jgi:hypothetical protein
MFYTLGVYSGVEVILELHEGGLQASRRRDLTILIWCPQIRQTYGHGVREKMIVLFVIEPWSSSPMASHVTDGVTPAHQS